MKGKTSLLTISLLLSSVSSTRLGWSYDTATKERDLDHNYPSVASTKEYHDFAKAFVSAETGAMKTIHQAKLEAAAEQESELKETYSKPYFTIVPSFVIPDYDGNSFLIADERACFGRPCKKSFLQLNNENPNYDVEDGKYIVFKNAKNYVQVDEDESSGSSDEDEESLIQKDQKPNQMSQNEAKNKWTDTVVNMGDLQEHKYWNYNAWIPDVLPHAATDHIENVGGIINDHFDATQGKFVSQWEINQKNENEAIAKAQSANTHIFKGMDRLVDDWTGTKYTIHPYGEDHHPPEFDTKLEQEAKLKNLDKRMNDRVDVFKKKSQADNELFGINKKEKWIDEEKKSEKKEEKKDDKEEKKEDKKDDKKEEKDDKKDEKKD